MILCGGFLLHQGHLRSMLKVLGRGIGAIDSDRAAFFADFLVKGSRSGTLRLRRVAQPNAIVGKS